MARFRPRQTSFGTGEIAATMEGRVDVDKYAASLKVAENVRILHSGAAQRRPGTRFVTRTKYPDRKVRTVAFQFSTAQAYVLEIGHLYIRFFTLGGRLEVAGVPVEVVTPYQESELAELNITQSADVLILVHPQHPPAKLSRFSPTLWRLETLTFTPPPSREFGTRPVASLTLSALTGTGVTFTASTDAFQPADVGRRIVAIGGTNLSAQALITAFTSTTVVVATIEDAFTDLGPIAATDWKVDASPKAQCTTVDFKPSGKTTTLTLDTAGWRGVTGLGDSDSGRYVLLNGGSFKIDSVTSSTVVAATIQGEASSATAAPAGAWTLEEAAWSAQNGYPGTVTFTDLDRLAFANTQAQPQTAWLSQSGDYFKFGVGILDSDAIIFTVNTDQVNAIEWIKAARDLIFGTSGAEFVIKAPQDAPLTPSNVTAKSNTSYGSSHTVDPQHVGIVILFVTRSGRKVREEVYEFASDTYHAPDLLLLAEHLTKPVRQGVGTPVIQRDIIDMQYQREPISTLWCVRRDGTLLGMTYLRDQNIVAWHRHILGPSVDDLSSVPTRLSNGTKLYAQMPGVNDSVVESVAVIPHPQGDREQVWVSVVRNIQGVAQRSIEYLDDVGHAWDYLNTDATVTYDGTVQTSSLTPSALGGIGVTFTSSSAAFTAADIGKEIRLIPYAGPRATITALQNAQAVLADIPLGAEWPSADPIAAGAWGLAAFSFSGLSHLEGRTVQIVGDGAVFPSQTVTSGTVTIDTAAVKVEVGLGYTSTMVSSRPEYLLPGGTSQGVKKRAARLVVRFSDTLGATVNGSDIPWRKSTDLLGEPPPLFHDDKDVTNLGYSRDGRVVIQQTRPLPMTVVLLSGVAVTGE